MEDVQNLKSHLVSGLTTMFNYSLDTSKKWRLWWWWLMTVIILMFVTTREPNMQAFVLFVRFALNLLMQSSES